MKKTTLMRMKEMERDRTLESMISEMAAAGLTDAEIARELGISTVTYYQWLHWLGAEFKRTREASFGAAVRTVAH
jgi:hypothetical protein